MKNYLILFLMIFGISTLLTFCNNQNVKSQKDYQKINNNGIELKPEIQGLVSMGRVGGILRHRGSDGTGSPHKDLDDVFSKPEIFSGAVINLAWKELEPEQDVLKTEVIDEVLAKVRKYNEEYHKTPLFLRLRVSCGRAAPDWAKKTGGEPVHILDPKGNYFYIGRFWTEEYRQAWRSFQDRLAAIYDVEPLIADVTVTSGMTNSDENMNLAITQEYALKNMYAAGFNDSLFSDIIMNCGEDYAAWKKTRLVFFINPYRFGDSGKPVFDEDFTLAIMRSFKERYDDRAILSNHSFQCCPKTERLDFIYQGIKELGEPFDYQTHAPKGIDMEATVAEAVAMGATTLELWNDYVNYPDEVLFRWKTLFDQNKK